MTFRRTLCAISASLFFAAGAAADDNRPLFIEITELAADSYQVALRVPPTIPTFNQPELVFPEGCAEEPAIGVALRSPSSQSDMNSRYFRCIDGLRGKSIEVKFPVAPPAVATVVRMNPLSEHSQTVVLPPGTNQWQVPADETRTSVARDYLNLGMYHIWEGTDHLLFVVCLICIAGNWQRTLTTITGFTIAHSITLALSALQLVRLPVPPIEAVIALSVVFLATEVAKGRRDNFTWRYPIAVSSTFGLLHGLGFAAALNEIGLPKTELVTGLLFFNVGVEVGQILFAIPVLCAFALLKRVAVPSEERADARASGEMVASHESRLERNMHRLLGYSVGILASFWLFDRLSNFVA